MNRSLALVFGLSLLFAGCGGASPAEQADAVQAALTGGKYEQAAADASKALADAAVKADKALAWRFERMHVEALAGQGQGAEALTEIKRLSGEYTAQVDAQLYAKLGNLVLKAGKTSGAIDLAEAGKHAFPQMAVAFDKLIEDIKTAATTSGDDASIARLKALGYL